MFSIQARYWRRARFFSLSVSHFRAVFILMVVRNAYILSYHFCSTFNADLATAPFVLLFWNYNYDNFIKLLKNKSFVFNSKTRFPQNNPQNKISNHWLLETYSPKQSWAIPKTFSAYFHSAHLWLANLISKLGFFLVTLNQHIWKRKQALVGYWMLADVC